MPFILIPTYMNQTNNIRGPRGKKPLGDNVIEKVCNMNCYDHQAIFKEFIFQVFYILGFTELEFQDSLHVGCPFNVKVVSYTESFKVLRMKCKKGIRRSTRILMIKILYKGEVNLFQHFYRIKLATCIGCHLLKNIKK